MPNQKHMKYLILFIAQAFLLTINVSTAIAQKEMALDPDLLKNSTPMLAKAKGIGTVTKYQFGPYKIASGKEGVTVTKSKSRFLSFTTESSSKRKLSFVFVRDDKDSVVVNVSVNTDLSEVDPQFLSGWSAIKERKENYIAILSIPEDTATWRMIIANHEGMKVNGTEQFDGVLTDGQTIIQLKEVNEWNTGKKGMMGLPIGHTFLLDGTPIAAVQASEDTFVKKTVWIRQDQNSKLQLILAAASAAMMVRSEPGE